MSMASPGIQNLAHHVVALETARANSPDVRGATDAHENATVRVIGELRMLLIRLVGVDGFRALLSRALTLAKAETPALDMVHVRADGSIQGFEVIEQTKEAGATEQAGTVLIAHVLKLLVTFIGESLTLRLVRDAWPDASTDGVERTA